ncbi:ATP-binding protein [Nocardioides sp. GCM10027113]|uniref:sensor histidine kinase n=1 Tax=unclassified Nocardioides TaxID=2615069 RepID=UPI00360DF2E6
MRARITLVVSALLAIALVGAGATVYVIELQRIEEQVVAEIDQEFAEFVKLQAEGVDAETGQPFRNVRSVLRTFLQRNVPADNELLIGWWDDGPQVQSPASTLTSDDAFVAAARGVVATNGDVRIDVEGHGELQVSAQRVVGGTTGALVVVVSLDTSRAGLQETMRTYAVVAALALLLVTLMALWLSGRLLAPLRTLGLTAEEISGTDLSRRIPETGNDDITALTRTVNGMLARLETAFEGQREFLDDVGHELRTPLTVLRGHLELVDPDNPPDVEQTRELLLEEVDRMSRLVGDLILLAKSRRPDFLELRAVDVSRLTGTLLSKARVLGDRDWQVDRTAEVEARLDEQRITQAVLQLADNAVKHTCAGDTIAVGTAVEGDHLRVWVRDVGDGVAASDRDHVFRRFGRSRVPEGDEGFGLGLSIVSAIAEAHGGTVRYEEPSPPGARFVMTVPLGEEDSWPTS